MFKAQRPIELIMDDFKKFNLRNEAEKLMTILSSLNLKNGNEKKLKDEEFELIYSISEKIYGMGLDDNEIEEVFCLIQEVKDKYEKEN